MKNLELAKLVYKQVTTFPEQFNMEYYGAERACGTVACLAGWAMLLTPGYTMRHGEFFRPDGRVVRCEDSEAIRLFGFEDDEYYGRGASPLFHEPTEHEALTRLAAIIEAEEARRAAQETE